MCVRLCVGTPFILHSALLFWTPRRAAYLTVALTQSHLPTCRGHRRQHAHPCAAPSARPAPTWAAHRAVGDRAERRERARQRCLRAALALARRQRREPDTTHTASPRRGNPTLLPRARGAQGPPGGPGGEGAAGGQVGRRAAEARLTALGSGPSGPPRSGALARSAGAPCTRRAARRSRFPARAGISKLRTARTPARQRAEPATLRRLKKRAVREAIPHTPHHCYAPLPPPSRRHTDTGIRTVSVSQNPPVEPASSTPPEVGTVSVFPEAVYHREYRLGTGREKLRKRGQNLKNDLWYQHGCAGRKMYSVSYWVHRNRIDPVSTARGPLGAAPWWYPAVRVWSGRGSAVSSSMNDCNPDGIRETE